MRSMPAATAALALLALTPTPAGAWQRVATVAELCAEAGGRPITRPTLVRGPGRDGPGEYVDLERCTITVARGAVLRLADVAVRIRGSGAPDASLAILLRDGAGLELLRSRIGAYSTSIYGIPSGGPVRLFNSVITGTETTASIATAGDVSLRGSSIDALRGGGIRSVNGAVDLWRSSIGGRDSVYLSAGPGGVRIAEGGAGSGQGAVGLAAHRGGGVTLVESRLSAVSVTLSPDAAGRTGAAVLVGNTFSGPDYIVNFVRFDLPDGAGCYTLDNLPEVACPPPSAGP